MNRVHSAPGFPHWIPDYSITCPSKLQSYSSFLHSKALPYGHLSCNMKSWKCNYFVNPLLLLLQKLLACWKELVLMYIKYYINWLDFLLDYPQIVLDIKNEPQCSLSLFFNFWRSTGLHTTVGTNYFKILKKKKYFWTWKIKFELFITFYHGCQCSKLTFNI